MSVRVWAKQIELHGDGSESTRWKSSDGIIVKEKLNPQPLYKITAPGKSEPFSYAWSKQEVQRLIPDWETSRGYDG